MKKNPLLNRDFLLQLDNARSKIVYVKLISLNNREEPIELIEGSVVSGSINIDGASSLSRSCSLTLTTNNTNLTNAYWSLTTRFKLYIGLNNDIDTTYDDIIWFPQGTFLITSFKISHGINSCSISISGKDKMALLNGDIGGAFPHPITLSSVDIADGNDIISKPTLIYDLIRELIHTYGKELYTNINIQDVAPYGLELINNNNANLYIKYTLDTETNNYTMVENNAAFWVLANNNMLDEDADISMYDSGKAFVEGSSNVILLNEEDDQYFIQYNSFTDTIAASNDVRSYVIDGDDNTPYYLMRYKSGEAIGYRPCDFIWPDQTNGLTVKAGETITSVLDKICSTIGNYEYFYDVNGCFNFQQKPTYINESWNNLQIIDNNEVYAESNKLQSQYSYSFTSDTLISSYDNNPSLANIKNNFSIWGKNSSSVDIQMCCAIQNKPTQYRDFNGKQWISSEYMAPFDKYYTLEYQDQIIPRWVKLIDWINEYKSYLKDYNDIKEIQNYLIRTVLLENNISYQCCRAVNSKIIKFDVLTNNTEIDDTIYIYDPILVVDWRELIYQMANDYQNYNGQDDYMTILKQNNPEYISGTTGFEQYYTDILAKWHYLYNYNPSNDELNSYEFTDLDYLYWNKLVLTEPNSLTFWFDFIEAKDSEFSKYSVEAIGNRLKAVNNDKIKAIVYKPAQNLLILNENDTEKNEEYKKYFSGYTPLILNQTIFESSTLVRQGTTAKSELDNLLYQNTCLNESISIRAIPIYYLEPNTLIQVIDKASGIDGDYIVSKISYNLSHKDLMSISATKKPNRIY